MQTAGNKFIHKSLTLIIDLKKVSILVWGGDAVECDFNRILLRFLDQDPNKPFLVKQALGYDLATFERSMKNMKTRLFLNSRFVYSSLLFFSRLRAILFHSLNSLLPSFSDDRSGGSGDSADIPAKDKSEMLAVIDLRVHLKKDVWVSLLSSTVISLDV